jgi:hypothetical protein
MGEWPTQSEFAERLRAGSTAYAEQPFIMRGFDNIAEYPETRLGIISIRDGNRYFQSVIELLSELDLVESVYLPHYLRTVTDLGEPGLLQAQGLVGIVKELSSLRDWRLSNAVPYGLLQFLVRLAQLPRLNGPINDWSPYPAKAGCPTIAGRRRTRMAPAGMASAVSWS